MTDKRVFLVSHGAYSDYHVLAAFVNEADATEYARQRTAGKSAYEDEFEVEWRWLYEEMPALPTVLTLTAQVNPGGVVSELRERAEIVDPHDEEVVASGSVHRVRAWQTGEAILNVYERGCDHSRVRKAFAERLTQAQETMKDIPPGTTAPAEWVGPL